ncbi:YihY/virulence factor BrkB family protein [Pedobacter miscanthi]|uniref:YihY/virulence factor BrkB family protein n=1 Tax=Pedobacter miscanthi TaxID=2259170 RepID=A0A366LDZ9_9SPHI|nr:YihY/virulence factor BrkB family protein [Pedobacter miscanthi]RBQ11729.1 YihY/virulence factor BrkB family protein [Pedobacter miscanthi]
MKKNLEISNLEELNAELLTIDRQISSSHLRIVDHGHKLSQFDLQSIIRPEVEQTIELISKPLSKMVPDATAKLLEKTIFSRLGFFSRKSLGLLSKAVVAKLMSEKDDENSIGPTGVKTAPKSAYSVEDEPAENRRHKPNGAQEAPLPAGNTHHDEQVTQLMSFKGIYHLLKAAFEGFSDHKVTKLSGSLSYYTVFSMAPLLLVVISLSAIFFNREAAEGQIFAQLKGLLGSDTALQLQELIRNAALTAKGNVAIIIGTVTLVLGATGIFADIQDSINFIWGIKPKPKRGWLKMLQNRFLSFSVIVSLGFLLVVSLGISALLDGFSVRLQARFSEISVVVFYLLNIVLTFIIITTIFGVIFKVLPDAKIKWGEVLSGAMVTAFLFMVGKFGISFYISKSNVGGTYGAAGSLVVLLLWTYYSSIILYFGAEFTKAFAVAKGADIKPNHYAVSVKEIEIEKEDLPVSQSSKEVKG